MSAIDPPSPDGPIVAHSAAPTRATALRQPDWVVFGLLAILTVSVAYLATRPPPAVGLVDDGVYLATGQALAEGRGYRHLELPGQPYQTKYPILYPLFLSLVGKVVPNFIDTITIVQVANALFWGLGCWLAYRSMRRLWQIPWPLPACAVVLTVANPAALSLVRTALSEPLYMLLAMAASGLMQLGDRRSDSAAQPGTGLVAALVTGLFASAAYLTRSIGLTVALAGVLHYLLARRWRRAAAAAAFPIFAAVGWQRWCAYADGLNSHIAEAQAFTYDLNYTIWIPHGFGTLLWVIYQNTAAVALEFVAVLAPLPSDWVAPDPQSGILAGGTGFFILIIGVCALAGLGFVTTWRTGRAGLHLYVLIYLSLVLAWPTSPARFLIPLLPFLIAFLLAGAYALTAFVVRLTARAVRPGELWAANAPRAKAATRVGVGLAVLLALPNLLYLITQPDRPGRTAAQQQRETLAEFAAARTPPGAVWCASEYGYMFLHSGRACVPFLPCEEPVKPLYPPDRRLGSCGRFATPLGCAADQVRVNADMLTYLRRTKTEYIVPPAEMYPAGRAFSDFRRANPHYFRLIESIGRAPVYQVVLP